MKFHVSCSGEEGEKSHEALNDLAHMVHPAGALLAHCASGIAGMASDLAVMAPLPHIKDDLGRGPGTTTGHSFSARKAVGISGAWGLSTYLYAVTKTGECYRLTSRPGRRTCFFRCPPHHGDATTIQGHSQEGS